MGILVRHGIGRAGKKDMHATFFQKVILCAIAGFLAASILQWAKVFVEGADDALNKGYKHRAVLDLHSH
jgi:hypothetical protein